MKPKKARTCSVFCNTALLYLALTSAAFCQTSTKLGCETFKQRLTTALAVYGIGPPTYEKDPTFNMPGETWWDIEGLGDVAAAELVCSNSGQFDTFEVTSRLTFQSAENMKSSLRTGIVMGAALRAYTDWPWKSALDLRDQMVKEANTQNDGNGTALVERDLPGATATLGIVGHPHFTIQSETASK
jgi:hypothetical protein